MQLHLIFIGKTDSKEIEFLMNDYLQRISHYAKCSVEIIQLKKANSNMQLLMKLECDAVISKLKAGDFLVLLDEKGKQFSSKEFAKQFENWQQQNHKRVVFVVGGAFGIEDELKERASLMLSFSKMTFTHQMIRLLLIEQIYRAYSIIHKTKYHHE